MPRPNPENKPPKKERHDARAVKLKDCCSMNFYIRLPAGAYPPPNSGAANKAKRAQISNDIVLAIEQYNAIGESPFVNYKKVFIGEDWVATNVIIHVPKPIWAAWKNKGLNYSFVNFVQKFFAQKI